MKLEIIDGSGKGYSARVDDKLRLRTLATTITEAENSTDNGTSYSINTGLVTLTSAAESGVLYLKNGEDQNIHIQSIAIMLGPSTGGSATDTTRIRFYRNPTTGTLISGATAVANNENRHFGSSNTLGSTLAYVGATGNTITDGDVVIESLASPGGNVVFDIDIILPKGKALAVSLEPNDSNTSMKCMATVICRLEDLDG